MSMTFQAEGPIQGSALETAAIAAGLIDLDLLRLARDGLTPAEAIADLRSRYPSAFRLDVRKMTPEQAAAGIRDLLGLNEKANADRRRAHAEAEMAKTGVRGLSGAEADRRIADYLRGLR